MQRISLERRLFDDSFRGWGRPLENGYCFAAGALFCQGLHAPLMAQRWVSASTALALLVDFGPSARRDLANSVAATEYMVSEYIRVSPPVILVNNFVENQGIPDLITEGRKETASAKLAASHRWALFVRGRVAADLLGVVMALSGRVCLGACFILCGHTGFWAAGAAAARVDSRAEPKPISPPLARLVGSVALGLAASAAFGAVGPTSFRNAFGRTHAVAMVVVQLARLSADRLRRRVHVGL